MGILPRIILKNKMKFFNKMKYFKNTKVILKRKTEYFENEF